MVVELSEVVVLVDDPGGDVIGAVEVEAVDPPAPGVAVSLSSVAAVESLDELLARRVHAFNVDVVSNVVGVASQAVLVVHDSVLVIILIVVVSE